VEIAAMARASERAADAARRAAQLEIRLERLRSGVSLTSGDVLFGRQAAQRAVGRALRADRDCRRARESARTGYKAAAGREAAAASLCRAMGAQTAAEDHNRMAAEYDLLAAVTHVAPWSVLDEEADAVRPADAPTSWPVGAAGETSRLRSRQLVVDDMSGLSGLRHELQDLLEAAGVDTSVVDEMTLAVEEVASNGIRHGKPPVQVTVSHEPQRLECAVIDQGPGFDWASVTDRPADDFVGEGRFGLRLAQALCDELTTISAPEGFVVRMVKRL
jgi:anti-sigma regulatory factor (Ser/Thr protein kinase)